MHKLGPPVLPYGLLSQPASRTSFMTFMYKFLYSCNQIKKKKILKTFLAILIFISNARPHQ